MCTVIFVVGILAIYFFNEQIRENCFFSETNPIVLHFLMWEKEYTKRLAIECVHDEITPQVYGESVTRLILIA